MEQQEGWARGQRQAEADVPSFRMQGLSGRTRGAPGRGPRLMDKPGQRKEVGFSEG